MHEAAALGVPVVASELLREQIGWVSGQELLSVPVGNGEEFARAVLALQRDAELWLKVRNAALERIALECGRGRFNAGVVSVV